MEEGKGQASIGPIVAPNIPQGGYLRKNMQL